MYALLTGKPFFMIFRYDINGLRAFAVIAVVLFHFNPSWVPGGFAGVDVFFVISGFLMTGIVFRGLENDDFNLFKFYVARANRIIPALATLCLVLLVFGWLWLPPIDYRTLGDHVLGSMGFLSNVIYWQESGYFDAASHEKWLLHTWSLSVEWQFYIIFPVVLMALNKILSIRNIKRLLVFGTLLGFAVSILATMKWANPAYYLLPTRAWEMMLGGLAFLYPVALKNNNKKIVEYTGLVLILISYAFMSNEMAWPGYLALVPVFGSYLVIIANRQDSPLTNNAFCQALGKWSYSIYLWHWPLVVGSYYFDVRENILIGLVLSVFLGWLSFQFIEKNKFSNYDRLRDVFKIFPLYLASLPLLIGYKVIVTDGYRDRVTEEYKLTRQQFRNKFEGHAGLYDKGNKPININSDGDDFDFILIGNSYARHYNDYFINNNVKIVSFALDGCVSTKNYYNRKKNLACIDRYQETLEFIKNNPGKNIIISKSWPGINSDYLSRDNNAPISSNIKDTFINELSGFLKDSQPYVNKVFVVGRTQGSKIIPFQYLAKNDLPIYKIMGSHDQRTQPYIKDVYNTILKEHERELKYVYVDPNKGLCNTDDCFVIKNGTPLYTDNSHLSKAGANLAGREVMMQISKYLK
ncbi:acyltransferase family protein [Vibrio splendidus]|uniref:acyltransferase family protein n=1 Tax=Vibrio splendidus TaxID=29497 RepID=UPI00352E4116